MNSDVSNVCYIKSKDIKSLSSCTRINYMGSKLKLLDWLLEIITKRIILNKDTLFGDLFAGSGIVSLFLRLNNIPVISNDSEYYSYILNYAFTLCNYNTNIANIIAQINNSFENKLYVNTVDIITKEFSPYNNCERMYFTTDNAKRIDYTKKYLHTLNLTDNDYYFIMASLITSADQFANATSMYTSYLKSFKKNALNPLILKPIHQITNKSIAKSNVYNHNILDSNITNLQFDIVYLDPPYNERQYSKYYFPLNIIAYKSYDNLELKGKTGIPNNCFLSSFCKKKNVKESFENLISSLKTKWIFISYNNESIISKNDMIIILEKYGSVEIEELDYKRFKSANINVETNVVEYLFCVKIYQK